MSTSTDNSLRPKEYTKDLWFVSNNTKFEGERFYTDAGPEYISERLTSKPKFTIATVKVCHENPEGLYSTAYSQIKTGKYTLPVACKVLIDFSENMKTRLTDDWTSFNIVIGKKGELCAPTNIIIINETQVDEELDTTTGVNETVKSWIVFYTLCIYRITKATRADYQEKLISDAAEKLKAYSAEDVNLETIPNNYKHWSLNRGYRALVAAYDMFLNKFRDHQHSLMRFGTISARYKDCSALLSIPFFQTVMGMPLDEALQWVFVENVALDIIRLIHKGQEIGKVDSYMPYLTELALTPKSPYSALVNPSFHNFCQMVGAFSFEPRSLNAILFNTNNLQNIRANALIVSYVFQQVVKTSANEEALTFDRLSRFTREDDLSVASGFTQELPPKDPQAWLTYLFDNNHTLLHEVLSYCKKAINSFDNIREGSIADFLKRSLSPVDL